MTITHTNNYNRGTVLQVYHELTVTDCLTEDDDTTRISLTCTGVSSN